MFEYFIALLSSDAFLAKLLKDIGLSDALTGILSSVISFSFLFGLLSIPLAGKLKKIKKPVIALDTASQLLFALLYTVPFFAMPLKGKTAAVTVIILLAYLTLYLNSSIAYKWGNSFVSPEKRGDFSATKEMISLVAGVIFTLSMGFITDRFEEKGNLHGAFIFIAAAMAVICLFNFGSFSMIAEKPLSESTARQSAGEIIKRTLKNRNCRNAIILITLTEFARYIAIGFMGTYKTIDLGFTVGQIQLMNVAANLGRFAVSKPFGRYSDRRLYSDGYFLGNILTLGAYVIGIFTSAKTKWLMLPFTMLYQMSFAGTNQNTFNMMYCFVDAEYILPAMTVSNSIRGISGFIASLIGSSVLSAVQKNPQMGFAGQQLLCVISALLIGVSLVFNKKIVSKQKQDKK